jgi:hypothetical protein
MIPYPISKLHKKIVSDKSSCDCNETLCSQSQSNASFCNKSDISDNSLSKYCAKEISFQNKNSCCYDEEKIIEFCENHTNGILKITKIKGNLGTGILKITNGDCLNLNSHIFKGLLSLSIINNTHNDVFINYNKDKRIVLKMCYFIVFKRKNDCKWEIMMIYEIKNKCDNYYYKGKKCEKKYKKEISDNENIIFENKCKKNNFDDLCNNSEDTRKNKKRKNCNCDDIDSSSSDDCSSLS